MCINEISSPFGKCIHVRRHRLRMASQEADPVVEIVNGDEQHVRLIRYSGEDVTRGKEKRGD